MGESMEKFNAQEAEVIEYFKKEGKKVYEPDQSAFRTLRISAMSRNTATTGRRRAR